MNPLFSSSRAPLTRTKRRIIFYLVVFLFLVVTPFALFYSLGYKLDFKTGQVTRTGGIFVKTNQAGFKIFINNALVKQAPFFSSGALITDLTPDLYMVRIEKDGFRPWQRYVHVSAETVTEFRYIMLVPEKPPEKEILNLSRRGLTIDAFRTFPGSAWIAIRVNEQSRITYFFNRTTKAIDAVETYDDFRWDSVGHRLVVLRKSTARWSVVSLGSNQIREERLLLPKKLGSVISVDFVPGSSDAFFVLNSDGLLYQLNKATGVFTQVLSDVYAFGVKENRILFINKSGFFSSSDIEGKNIENYGRKGLFLSDTPVRFESVNGQMFVVDSGGGVFVRNSTDPEIIPTAGNVKDAAFDSAGGKIVYCTDHDITVLWLKDESYQPFRKAGTRERIITLPGETISSCDWFGADEENIIFSAGKFIGFVDVDTRGSGAAAAILFDNATGSFAFDKETGEIFRSDKSFLFSTSLY